MNKIQEKLVIGILSWYEKYGRVLPWRETSDPYKVLVSEMMLQQTQVSRVIEKWHVFLALFPTVQQLAIANTAEVITAWQGLGYNRRALYLQKIAQAVAADFDGNFPTDIDTLKTLPGIGDYTARAILSFAFDKPVPMMDTNHRKFYMRVFFDTWVTDDMLLEKAEEVITFVQTLSLDGKTPPNFPYKGRDITWHWNQALMDFMSAVAKKEENFLVHEFINTYPDIPNPKKKKQKKTVPFKQTDRYIRGRIIDILRTDEKVSQMKIIAQLSEFPKERIQKNIQNLVSEGLIEIVGRSIILARSTL